jgi:hypothetical protein
MLLWLEKPRNRPMREETETRWKENPREFASLLATHSGYIRVISGRTSRSLWGQQLKPASCLALLVHLLELGHQ